MMANRPERARLYHRSMPATWWLRKRSYLLFMLRELTSLPIAIFLIVFLVQLHRLGQGAGTQQALVRMLSAPGWVLFHVVALAFAVYHSVTWFYTTSIVMPLKLGGRELPRWLFTSMNIGLWLVVSVAIWVLSQGLQGVL